jgi:hypothetical protein
MDITRAATRGEKSGIAKGCRFPIEQPERQQRLRDSCGHQGVCLAVLPQMGDDAIVAIHQGAGSTYRQTSHRVEISNVSALFLVVCLDAVVT